MDYQSPDNRESQHAYPTEHVDSHSAAGSPQSQKNDLSIASPQSPLQRADRASPQSPTRNNNVRADGSPQSPTRNNNDNNNNDDAAAAGREERLEAARAKASAAKAAAQRRSSRRSMSSANSADGGDRSQTDFGSEPRSHEGSRRRSSIRSLMQSADAAAQELAELRQREQDEAAQLQLYSDVIALRKERVVVAAAEARARRQRDAGDSLLAQYDATLEEKVAKAEAAAQQSSLQHVWAAVAQQFPPEMADDSANWLQLNTEDMEQRLAAAQEQFQAAQQDADRLYAVQEEKINAQTDDRDKTKANLEESLREEMANLEESRARLQQLQREQRHHIKRGTHVKELHVPQQRRRDVTEGRIYSDENKTFASKFALENECAELTEQVKQSKRVLEDNKRDNKKAEVKLENTLKETEESGKEAHELREKLEKESEGLKGLKQDLQRVLQYVRTRNYAGED